MRFTSAFIPTLLSASTVLAYLEPYAGYQTQLERERPEDDQRWFSSVSAVVTIPQLSSRQCGDIEVGFLAVVLGDPRIEACNGASFEAGLTIQCNHQANTFGFHPYARNADGDILSTALHSDDIAFQLGDKFRMEISVFPGGRVFVRFFNLSRGELSFGREIGDSWTIWKKCLATAMWVMKANVLHDGTFQTLPMFDQIQFSDIMVEDNLGREVGYQVPGGLESPERLVMRAPDGTWMASPYKLYSDDTQRSFIIMNPPTLK